jgi:hypothetical protein
VTVAARCRIPAAVTADVATVIAVKAESNVTVIILSVVIPVIVVLSLAAVIVFVIKHKSD